MSTGTDKLYSRGSTPPPLSLQPYSCVTAVNTTYPCFVRCASTAPVSLLVFKSPILCVCDCVSQTLAYASTFPINRRGFRGSTKSGLSALINASILPCPFTAWLPLGGCRVCIRREYEIPWARQLCSTCTRRRQKSRDVQSIHFWRSMHFSA